jgi:hypothetical protein
MPLKSFTIWLLTLCLIWQSARFNCEVNEQNTRLLLFRDDPSVGPELLGVVVRELSWQNNTNRIGFLFPKMPKSPEASRASLPDPNRNALIFSSATDKTHGCLPRLHKVAFLDKASMLCFKVTGSWTNLPNTTAGVQCCTSIYICGQDGRLYAAIMPIYQKFKKLDNILPE